MYPHTAILSSMIKSEKEHWLDDLLCHLGEGTLYYINSMTLYVILENE